MKKNIHITGMGIQCAIGNSIPEFTASLREGRCGIGFLTEAEHSPANIKIAAKLQNFVFQDQLNKITDLPPSVITLAKLVANRTTYPIHVSIIAALQAWQDAKLHEHPIPAKRLGIVVACDNTSQRFHYDALLKFQTAPDYVSPRYALHALETDHVGTISELLSIQGEGFVVAGASASGNVALIKAAQLIELGLVDACLVLGTLSELSPLALQGYSNLGAMGAKKFFNAPDQACRPFDVKHEGFIYGEGCGCIILESNDSAKRRNITKQAEYMAGLIRLDGNRLADPNEQGEAETMQECLTIAGLSPANIDYINTHGSSSALGDITEINAIKQIFNSYLEKIWINATKGLTGHCLFSAGVIEAIACVIQMRNGFIHPNKNLNDPIDQHCRFVKDEMTEAKINITLSNSFGFGGINTAIILKNQGE